MELPDIQELVSQIRGCTFASLDAVTIPSPGIRIVTNRLRVILFACGYSGYEAMVRRRLEAIGKDPLAFSVGDLPWGERLDNLPIILNHGKPYLQTIPIGGGEAMGWIGERPVPVDALRASLRIPKSDPSQGLPEGRQVRVRCYALDNITAIRLMGEEVR